MNRYAFAGMMILICWAWIVWTHDYGSSAQLPDNYWTYEDSLFGIKIVTVEGHNLALCSSKTQTATGGVIHLGARTEMSSLGPVNNPPTAADKEILHRMVERQLKSRVAPNKGVNEDRE